MDETKLYYLGTGTEFVKAQCKEYKTIDGVLKAAAKDESLVVWDEDGNIIGSLTDNISDNTKIEDDENQNADEDIQKGSEENQQTESGQSEAGTASDDLQNQQSDNQNDDEETDESEENDEDVGAVQLMNGKAIATVICEGTLNLRRSASYMQGNECGRASKGQKYYVQALHIIGGKAMIETIDGIFLSGEKTHVKIENIEE